MKWHFYRLSDGVFTGAYYSSADDSHLSRNTPLGHGAMSGVKNWRSQRVVDGKLVDYIPPAPTEHHEWDGSDGRYRLTKEAQAQADGYRFAIARIDSLERASLRCLRELALDPTSEIASTRLSKIEAEIVALRTKLLDKAAAIAQEIK